MILKQSLVELVIKRIARKEELDMDPATIAMIAQIVIALTPVVIAVVKAIIEAVKESQAKPAIA